MDHFRAVELGLPRYWTGRPCPKGHFADRTTVDCKCVQCTLLRSSARLKRNRERMLGTVEKGSTFVPAKPCARGHRERYTLSGGCVKCSEDGSRARYIAKIRAH